MRNSNANHKQLAPSKTPEHRGDDAPKPAEGRVLVDSNQVPALNRNPTLDGRIGQNEQSVISFVTGPELRNVVSINRRTGRRGLRGVPKVLNQLLLLDRKPDIHLKINVRGKLPSDRGRFGDGIIGAQALENQLPLVTRDRNLADVVEELGGIVRR